MTAFRITRDYIADDKHDDTYAVGTVGPSSASDKDVARLKAGEGVKFRLLDDDRNVYYHGVRLETSDADDSYDAEPELAPLDCFGTPYAGCVIQEERNAAGEWEAIN